MNILGPVLLLLPSPFLLFRRFDSASVQLALDLQCPLRVLKDHLFFLSVSCLSQYLLAVLFHCGRDAPTRSPPQKIGTKSSRRRRSCVVSGCQRSLWRSMHLATHPAANKVTRLSSIIACWLLPEFGCRLAFTWGR